MVPFWLWVVLALVGLQRVLELLYARKAAKRLSAAGARWIPEDGYGLIVAVHVLLFVGCVAEGLWAPWPQAGWWTFAGGFLYALGAALRYTSMAALKERWSTRVYTLPGAPLVASGPYRYVRHPIYLGVFLELLGIPLLGGFWLTLLVLTMLHIVALRRRIRIEERALGLD